MAACAVETIFDQRIDTMHQTKSSSFETLNQHCSLNCHLNSIERDTSIILRNVDLTKKRPLRRCNTYNNKIELSQIVTDNSCSTQAASANNEILASSIRPKTLSIIESTNNQSMPRFRTCLSHPSTLPEPFFPINDNNTSEPLVFTSLPAITSVPTKRLRSPTPTKYSTPIITITTPATAAIQFIDSSELAEKLQEPTQRTIFDCGSPLRFSDHHLSHAYLLRVADKISRKRLKTNPSKHLTINIDELNECDWIILYDDNTDNHQDLSIGLKCASEEIQRCLTIKFPPIYILKNSFQHFFSLYPHFCQSSQPIPDSCLDESLPQLTPISPNTEIQNYPMTQIINGLYIGTESNAKNLEELSSEQIRYIVNVTSHVPLYHSDRLHYHHIPADDTQKQNLLDYFDQAYQFIHQAIEKNEKVLVHCVAGISRSPAIVISFLMRYAHMNVNDAYELVKSKRSIVSPNLNFMGQLLQYEKRLNEQN